MPMLSALLDQITKRSRFQLKRNELSPSDRGNIASLLNEPHPFATLAAWEQHLAGLEQLPNGILLKPQMIETAKKMIAKKKSNRLWAAARRKILPYKQSRDND